MNELLKSSDFQARDDSVADPVERRPRLAPPPTSSRSSALPPTATEPNRNRWPVSARVQAPRVVDEGREAVRAGGEPDARTDRADVVEGVPDALELEQDRPGPRELGRGDEPEQPPRRRGRRRRRSSPSNRRRRARRPAAPSASVQPFGRPFEAAVLVEEPGVDVEDQVADDVEPEVARLDHAGVDRADGDLVRVGAAHRRREPGERRRRGRRAVAAARGRRSRRRRDRAPPARPSPRRERGRRSSAPSPPRGVDALDAEAHPSGELSSVRTAGSAVVGRGVEAREAPAVRERRRDGVAVRRAGEWSGAQPSPRRRPSTIAESGSQSAAAVRASSSGTATAVSVVTARSPGAGSRSRRRGLPDHRVDRARARARGTRARGGSPPLPAAQGRPTWKPPATISTSLTKRGDGGSPASAPSETPSEAPSAGSVLPMPPTAVAGGAWVVAEERRRCIEAERLRERVADDVDRDAGECERAAEADPERDHAHVLEARVGEQALPRLRAPEERHRHGERDEPEADEHAAGGANADRRRECLLRAPGDEQHGRQQSRREERRDGGRRLGVGVGEPVVHGRPADLGREAGEQQHVRDHGHLRVERACGKGAPGQGLDARRRRPPPRA